MNRFILVCVNIARVAIGLVFIYSGFVKGIDPWGFTYKLIEYFEVIGLHNVQNLSLALSVMLSAAEFILGVALLFALLLNFTAWVSLFFMSFFTLLTLLLAVFNPVTDCGCFGDAIILTNWETFFKNVVLILLVILVFYNRKQIKLAISLFYQWLIVITATIIFLSLQLYCYNHLPVIDYMPYSVGTYIPEKMIIPENAPRNEFKTTLFYKKNGIIKEFNEANFPWQDTTWVFVDSKSILVKAGYKPAIHDFSISTSNGFNLVDSILNDTSYTFVFIAKNISEVAPKTLVYIDSMVNYGRQNNTYKLVAVTSSPNLVCDSVIKTNNLTYNFNSADQTALKTIIRAKAGMLLLKKGVIIGKWHYNDFNTINYKHKNLLSYTITEQTKYSNTLFWRSFFAVLALLLVCILAIGIKKHR